MQTDELARRDLSVLWHPCTQMHDHEQVPLIPIVRGEGAWLVAADGRRYLDGISSWWTNLFGHANPQIAAAIAAQTQQLEQVIFAGFTHAPAIELAERLLALAPPGLARVFYADNGSAAVEVALKMSFHYWQNRNEAGRTRFIALSGGYHGETLGALAVGDTGLYRDAYAPLLMQRLLAPSPDAYDAAPGEDARAVAQRALDALDALLAQHAGTVCAVIVEPRVQCAGGMRMYHPAYLTGLRTLCDRHGVHLIADEIAVGFGRTGTLFACEQAPPHKPGSTPGITPDFLCLSKGITGGFLPFAAVLTSADVYAAFYAEYNAGKAFLHSHSYTGNPLACAAALATLEIFRTQPVLQRNRVLAARLAQRLEVLRAHPQVADVRQTGLIAAVELVADKASRTPYPARERRGLRARLDALQRGVLLRPLGDVIYAMPPYCVTEAEIDQIADAVIHGVAAACR